jgi:uncharacterized membrane protein YeaQ/YmgE (transglycosylase-associated protein family)
MHIIMWIVFGFVVGVIAKFLTPGREPAGFMITTVIGVVGSLLGGFVGRAVGLYPSYQHAGGFVMSIIGAIVLLVAYHAIIGRRTLGV